MGDPPAGPGAAEGGAEKELPTEDNIRVICRFRPLNDSEEKAGSKFIIKFPDEQCASIAVSICVCLSLLVVQCDVIYGIKFPGQSLRL